MSYHLPPNLKSYGEKITSQTDEDGIIAVIFNNIPARSKTSVEFGVGPDWLDTNYTNGLEANCVRLRDEMGWKGIFIDGADHPVRFNVVKEFIKATEINSLFRKYEVPENVDIVSIDIDGQDFWVFMAPDYRLKLYIIEYNPYFMQLYQKKLYLSMKNSGVI